MTHAMILTAVTDKVHTETFLQVCVCRAHANMGLISRQIDSNSLSHQSLAACLGCSNRLQFLMVMSISPVLSNPSCQNTELPVVSGSHSYLPIDCLFIFQGGKEGFEKWRVENSWGDDRGNKGNTTVLSAFLGHFYLTPSHRDVDSPR